jgi:hypothetical protein
MSDFEESKKIDLEEIKGQISQVSQKPLDAHPQEFENIHSNLVQALSEIDGL